MGCSHYILNKYLPVTITIRCYDCGKEIDLNNPAKGHEKCWAGTYVDDDGSEPMAVDIEIENTRER
jgi:hypothetical protein